MQFENSNTRDYSENIMKHVTTPWQKICEFIKRFLLLGIQKSGKSGMLREDGNVLLEFLNVDIFLGRYCYFFVAIFQITSPNNEQKSKTLF